MYFPCAFIACWALIVQFPDFTGGTGLKIVIDPASLVKLQYMFTSNQDDPCQNYTIITDKASVKFPPQFQDLHRPWLRTDIDVTIISHPTLKERWNQILTLNVAGLDSIIWTVGSVLQFFVNNGCMVSVWGGSVRELVNGKAPVDVDAENTCTIQEILSLCTTTFGADNCNSLSGNTVQVGHGSPSSSGNVEPFDFASWNKTFEVSPTNWEYSPNAMAFYDDFDGTQVLLDMTGFGFTDTCTHQIRLPVPKAQWPDWGSLNTTWKILRFWKLRAKGFQPYNVSEDNSLLAFLNQTLQENNSLQSVFQNFYCTYPVNGEWLITQNICVVQASNQNENLQIAYKQAWETDLGLEYWESVLSPWVKSIQFQVQVSTSPSTTQNTTQKSSAGSVPAFPSTSILTPVPSLSSSSTFVPISTPARSPPSNSLSLACSLSLILFVFIHFFRS